MSLSDGGSVMSEFEYAVLTYAQSLGVSPDLVYDLLDGMRSWSRGTDMEVLKQLKLSEMCRFRSVA